MNSKLQQVSTEAIHKLVDGGNRLKDASMNLVGALDRNHENIADHADSIAKGAKVAAGLAVAGAVVAAPTGLTAVGVAVGLVSAPVIVTAAPLIASAAGVAMTVSAGASLYSKLKRKRAQAKVTSNVEGSDS